MKPVTFAMKSPEKYKFIEHTADAALKVYGSSLNQLFIHAAEGMFALIMPQFPEPSKRLLSIELSAISAEELLVAFLNELNFFLIVRHRLLFPFKELQITRAGGAFNLYCRAQVAHMTPRELAKIQEIKAVTYHQLSIKSDREGYWATLVFDL